MKVHSPTRWNKFKSRGKCQEVAFELRLFSRSSVPKVKHELADANSLPSVKVPLKEKLVAGAAIAHFKLIIPSQLCG